MDNCSTAWQTITRGGCVRKAWEPPSSRPILIYFEFRSKPSLITVVCMDPHSPKKLFATKYWFLILFSFISRFFLFVFVFAFLCYFTLLLMFTKIILLIFFFMKIISIFSCSGMFRNVPCSGFYRRPTQRYFQLVVASLLPSEYIEDITWQRGDIRILSSSERYFQHEVREILSAWGKNNK